MRETFNEYKETLESNLSNFTFLYSGDVINSIDESYIETCEHNNISPSFIIRCFDNIYKKSIENLIKKTNKHKNITSDLNIDEQITDLISSNDTKYIFCSEKTMNILSNFSPYNGAMPKYFKSIKTYMNHNNKILLHYSPFIKNEEDGIINLYFTNNPIQSLVYVIQNMEYNISGSEHIIKYPFYVCNYKSHMITTTNVWKMREDKLKYLIP